MKYSIEIYEPWSEENVIQQLESDESPFPSIHAGDLIDPLDWPGSGSPMRVLRVTAVKHLVWPSRKEEEPGLKHRLMVYTEEVENTDELRWPAGRRQFD